MPFLRRPRPGTNKVFSSYLLRLTQANGYTNYQAILDYVDINSNLHKLNYLSEDEADLTALIQMAQIEEAQLWDTIFRAIALFAGIVILSLNVSIVNWISAMFGQKFSNYQRRFLLICYLQPAV